MKALSIYIEMQIAWWKMFSKQSTQSMIDVNYILTIIEKSKEAQNTSQKDYNKLKLKDILKRMKDESSSDGDDDGDGKAEDRKQEEEKGQDYAGNDRL